LIFFRLNINKFLEEKIFPLFSVQKVKLLLLRIEIKKKVLISFFKDLFQSLKRKIFRIKGLVSGKISQTMTIQRLLFLVVSRSLESFDFQSFKTPEQRFLLLMYNCFLSFNDHKRALKNSSQTTILFILSSLQLNNYLSLDSLFPPLKGQ